MEEPDDEVAGPLEDGAEDDDPEENDVSEDEEDPLGSTASVYVQGAISGGSVAIAESIVQNIYNDSAAQAVHLSRQHFRTWTPKNLDHCEAELIADESTIERLDLTLEESRILILHGEPEVGKGMTALLAGARMQRRKLVTGVLSCQSPASEVLVNLQEIAGSADFRHQLVLIEDAIAGENSDLLRFLGSLDSMRLDSLAERLTQNGAFLILTASSDSLTLVEKRLHGLKVLARIEPPPSAVLTAALELLARRLPESAAEAETLHAFLEEHGEKLALDLKTVPRIARFVREYLADVAARKLPLKQALDRLDNLSPWLLHDLASDLDARSAALALVVGSAVPPANAVPWFQFDRLRRAVLGALREELRPAAEPLPVAGPETYLDHARAHAVAMPAPLSDVVRFRDDRYPARLWRVLLGPGRGISTQLLPLLHELTRDGDPFLRAAAARALGRIGQIGPADVAGPSIAAWGVARDPVQDDLLGSFLQGAMASEDPAYRDFCLSFLRRLAFGRGAAAAEAVVHGLRLLGRPDPALPLRELRRIAHARLPIQTAGLREFESKVVEAEAVIRRGRNLRNVTGRLRKLHAQAQVWMAAELVPEPELPLLAGLQHSLAGVLFSQGGDPGPVLAELNLWMVEEPERLSPLLAFLFLHRRGLFDLLDRHKWFPGAFTTEACSRFLLAARQTEAGARELRRFVEGVVGGSAMFPGIFRHFLETRLLQILKSWAKEGCTILELRPVVIRLFACLLEADDPDLRQSLFEFLKTDPDFCVKGSRLRALAIEALTGGARPQSLAARRARPGRAPSWFKRS